MQKWGPFCFERIVLFCCRTVYILGVSENGGFPQQPFGVFPTKNDFRTWGVEIGG